MSTQARPLTKAEARRKRPPLRQLITRFSVRNRTRKAQAISEFMDAHSCHTVLMVGALTPVGPYPNQGIVERAVAKGRSVVMGINLEQPEGDLGYPFQIADARNMPFEDDWVDFALANAIIEHVGDEQDQRRMIEEMTRVARSWVITTPNKWFPIEAHTAKVLRHWSPSWRAQRDEFTRLLSRRELKALLPADATVTGHWWSPTFAAYWSR